MYKKAIFLMFFSLGLFANETSSSLTKQKIEVQELKKQLNDFYNQKEEEYKKRKKELEEILAKVEKEKNEIKNLHDKNLEILQDIEGLVKSKTTKIYDSMKPKIAAGIFNQMINEGKIEDVFAIILKLKEKKVTLLMKFLSVQNAARITEMLENYSVEDKTKG